MTRTESIGRRFGGSFIVVVVFAIACAFAIIAISLDYVDWTTREMSAIANDGANRKAHERTAKWFVSAHADASKRTGADLSASREIAVRSASAEVISLKTKQKAGELQSRVAKASNPSSSALAASPKGLIGTVMGTRRSPEREPVTADTEGQPRADEASRSLSMIPLRPIQEDAWKSTALVPANRPAPQKFSSSAESAATAVSIAEATPNRPHAVQHPTNPHPFDLSGLPMYSLISDGADWYRMVPDGAAETEDIITTITFRRNDLRNKVDLTHPISICVDYPDAADHPRSCGAANWMAPDTNDLTIDVVMPRRNTSGEPYARFGQNITCNVTYYDEREGAHMVMTSEQWSGGDCGAIAMIVVGAAQ